ncbi:MAG: FimV/HubP family polar landmark protein, partial [Pseudomonadales bacterium]
MFRYLLRRLRASTLKPAAASIATICLLTTLPAWGLGLGDIDLESSLNEPLNARIELLDVQGLQPTEIMVSLATPQDFQRVGVERFHFLTDLRFEVSFGDGGLRNIRVFSSQAITEPYLNFLVEVLWPSGRMLKEYTLLLDPPTFTPAPAPAVAAPARTEQAAADAGRVQRDAPTAAATPQQGTRVEMATRPSPQQASPLDQGVVGGEYRMTDRNDTLWAIAARTRPSSQVSVMQNMLALQRLNPDAFLNGNINLLKAGYSLRLPSESEALALGNAEANELVAMQTADWRAMQRGETPAAAGQLAAADVPPAAARREQPAATQQSQLDATPARAPAQAAAAPAGGELRIVATAGDGAAGGSLPAAAEERLNAILEEQDRLAREVEALSGALSRERELAANQLSIRDRQLEVRDQQIAQMQAELQRLREQAAVTPQSQNQNAPSAVEAWWQSPYALGAAAGLVVLLLAYGLVAARRRRAADSAGQVEPL